MSPGYLMASDPSGREWPLSRVDQSSMYWLGHDSGYAIVRIDSRYLVPFAAKLRNSDRVIESINDIEGIEEFLMINNRHGYMFLRHLLRFLSPIRCRLCRAALWLDRNSSSYRLRKSEICDRCEDDRQCVLAEKAHQERIEAEQQRINRGCVYCIRRRDTGRIKIGYSGDWENRLSNIAMGGGHATLDVLLVVRGDEHLEHRAHAIAADSRIVGEWFADSTATRSAIDSLRTRQVVSEGQIREYGIAL